MRRIFKLRKRTAVALSVIAVLAIAGGAAFAYLSSTGTGIGSGNVTASSTPLTLTFSQPAFNALPQTQTVNIYATNSGNSGEWFSGLASYAVSPTSSSCPAGSFTSQTPSTTAQEIPANTGPTLVGTAVVTFNDLSQLQNACLGTGAVSYTATSN